MRSGVSSPTISTISELSYTGQDVGPIAPPMDTTAVLDFDSPPATPHPTYYMRGGMIEIRVERTLFCIPRSYLTRESTYFTERLQEFDSNQAQNFVHLQPFCIDDVSSVEFGRLLAAMDPLESRVSPLHTLEEWSSVLRVAHRWDFVNTHAVAVHALESLTSPIDKIILGRTCAVDNWLFDAFVSICQRSEPLSIEDGEDMRKSDIIRIARVRECLRSLPNQAIDLQVRRMVAREFRALAPLSLLDDSEPDDIPAATPSPENATPHTDMQHQADHRTASPPPTYTADEENHTASSTAFPEQPSSNVPMEPSNSDQDNLRRVPRLLSQLSQHDSKAIHEAIVSVVRRADVQLPTLEKVVRRVLADAIDAWSGCASPTPAYGADRQRHINLFKSLSEVISKVNIASTTGPQISNPVHIEQGEDRSAFITCLLTQCLYAVDDWKALLSPRASIFAPRADIDRVIPATTYIGQLVERSLVPEVVFDTCWKAMIAALDHLDVPLATNLRKFLKAAGRTIYTPSACLLIDDFYCKLELHSEDPEDAALRYDVQQMMKGRIW